MTSIELFTAALELTSPWYVSSIKFKDREGEKELHIEIDHKKGVKFEFEGDLYPIYDHQERTWKHLDFFQHTCYLHAKVPRVKLRTGEVRLVSIPWSSKGSSFTLLFEDKVLSLGKKGMSIRAISEELRLSWGQAQRIILRRTSQALAHETLEDVEQLSVDETSRRKGHSYFTIMADRARKKVVGVSIGKDKDAFAHALLDMELRGADRQQVKTITMDMSKSYISASQEFMSHSSIIFDRFHIMKKLNEAVDKVRREEQRQHQEQFKRTRYLWLKNGKKLTDKQQQRVADLSNAYPNIGTAYRLKELFKQILDQAYYSNDLSDIGIWLDEAYHSGIEPIKKFVDSIHKHWEGVEAFFQHLATNALAERINLKIQEIKRTAKGFRNSHNFMLMIYFHLGGLNLNTHYK